MILFDKPTASKIQSSVGRAIPETGGIIGSKNGVICKFYYDYMGYSTSAYYMPSTAVEAVIRLWHSQGYTFEGFIHSHVVRFSPTETDIKYSLEVLRWYEDEFGLCKEEILIPIVESVWNSNEFRIYGFLADKAGELLRCKTKV